MVKHIENDAIISADQVYRYSLMRRWRKGDGTCLFIMLNPSTADARQDDPTIRRCIGYAERWGYGDLVVGNLFAFRATKPDDLKKASDPVGSENEIHLEKMCKKADVIIAAWGQHGKFMRRGDYMQQWASKKSFMLHYLKLCKDGTPAHPLYLRSDLKPERWII